MISRSTGTKCRGRGADEQNYLVSSAKGFFRLRNRARDCQMCAFEEDQGPASKKRASLSTSEPRVSGQIGMPRFEMFIETARVWETSGKPPASSLPGGISALPLLVPAKAGSAEACSEQNTGKKNATRRFCHKLAKNIGYRRISSKELQHLRLLYASSGQTGQIPSSSKAPAGEGRCPTAREGRDRAKPMAINELRTTSTGEALSFPNKRGSAGEQRGTKRPPADPQILKGVTDGDGHGTELQEGRKMHSPGLEGNNITR